MVQWSAPSRVRKSGPLLVVIVQVYLYVLDCKASCFSHTSTQALRSIMRRLHKARADGCGQAGGVHAGQYRSKERAAT